MFPFSGCESFGLVASFTAVLRLFLPISFFRVRFSNGCPNKGEWRSSSLPYLLHSHCWQYLALP